jgi:hypothetical protein
VLLVYSLPVWVLLVYSLPWLGVVGLQSSLVGCCWFTSLPWLGCCWFTQVFPGWVVVGLQVFPGWVVVGLLKNESSCIFRCSHDEFLGLLYLISYNFIIWSKKIMNLKFLVHFGSCLPLWIDKMNPIISPPLK